MKGIFRRTLAGLLATTAVVLATSASAVTQNWVQRLGFAQPPMEAGHQVARDGAGNTIVAGERWVGPATFSDASRLWLAKYASTGARAWQIDYLPAGGIDVRVKSLAVDSAGNPVVLLSSLATAFGPLTGDVVAKFNGANGAQLWVQPLTGISGNSLRIDAAGNVLVGGVTFSLTTNVTSFAVRKLTGAAGATMWNGTATSPNRNFMFATGMSLDSAGNPVLIGTVGNEFCSAQDTLRGFIARWNGTTGALSWSAEYNNASLGDRGVDVAQDAAGDVVAVFGSETASGERMVTRKYVGGTGAVSWTQVFNFTGSFGSAPLKVRTGAGNAIYVMGTGDINFFPGVFAVRYNSTGGAPIWSRGFELGQTLDPTGDAKRIDFDGTGNPIFSFNELRFGTSGFEYKFWTTELAAANGAVQWTNKIPAGTGSASSASMVVDSTGNPVVVGTLDGTNKQIYVQRLNATNGAQLFLISSRVVNNWGRTDISRVVVPDRVSNGSYVAGNTGGHMLIARYNSVGTRVWTRIHDVVANGSSISPFDGITDVVVDAAGNPIVLGTNRGQTTVVKFAVANGATLWSRNLDGSVPDGDESLVIDAAGNVQVLLNRAQATVIKLNGATGAILWTREFAPGGSFSTYGSAIDIDASGNASVVGTRSAPTTGCPSTPSQVIQTFKVNGTSGATMWSSIFQGPIAGDPEGVDIEIDGAGNVLITGQVVALAPVSKQMVTQKLNGATGANLWYALYTVPGSVFNEGTHLSRDAANNVYVTGLTASNTGFFDIVTLKYGPNGGAPLWVNRFNNNFTGFVYPSENTVDAAGNVYVTGTNISGGFANFVTYRLNTANGALAWTHGYSNVGTGAFTDLASDLYVEPTSNQVLLTGPSQGAGVNNTDWVTIRLTQ